MPAISQLRRIMSNTSKRKKLIEDVRGLSELLSLSCIFSKL